MRKKATGKVISQVVKKFADPQERKRIAMKQAFASFACENIKIKVDILEKVDAYLDAKRFYS